MVSDCDFNILKNRIIFLSVEIEGVGDSAIW